MHNETAVSLSSFRLIEEHPVGDVGGQAKVLHGWGRAKEEDDGLVPIHADAHHLLTQRARGRGRAVVVGGGVDRPRRGRVVGGGEEVLGVVETCEKEWWLNDSCSPSIWF